MDMIRKKILLAGVIGIALVGAGFAALAIRSSSNEAVTPADTSQNPAQVSTQPNSTADQSTVDKAAQPETSKVASGTSTRRYSSRSTYYDYNNQPQKRTFWQKHRDKLTVAAGAGTGALVGVLIG